MRANDQVRRREPARGERARPGDQGPERRGRTGVRGDLVLSPFTCADNTGYWCRRGLHTSCPYGGRYGFDGVDGGQGEAVRVPQASGTLVRLSVAADSALLSSLMNQRRRDGRRRGRAVRRARGRAARAAQVVLMGRHSGRTSLTDGRGADAVLECVGSRQTLTTSFAAVRASGVISRVGVPSYTDGPIGMGMIMRNVTLTGGVDPARHYIDEIPPDVLEDRIEPGRVFDRTLDLDAVPDGSRAMADRGALKVLITP
jgi:threonine dehydrogenase-like Zn-dependent dehydrogenase